MGNTSGMIEEGYLYDSAKNRENLRKKKISALARIIELMDFRLDRVECDVICYRRKVIKKFLRSSKEVIFSRSILKLETVMKELEK